MMWLEPCFLRRLDCFCSVLNWTVYSIKEAELDESFGNKLAKCVQTDSFSLVFRLDRQCFCFLNRFLIFFEVGLFVVFNTHFVIN